MLLIFQGSNGIEAKLNKMYLLIISDVRKPALPKGHLSEVLEMYFQLKSNMTVCVLFCTRKSVSFWCIGLFFSMRELDFVNVMTRNSH